MYDDNLRDFDLNDIFKIYRSKQRDNVGWDNDNKKSIISFIRKRATLTQILMLSRNDWQVKAKENT